MKRADFTIKLAKQIGSIFISLLIALSSIVHFVYAEEYTITDNGDGSSSELNIQNSNNQSVSQQNNATVENDVSSNATTGNNSTSDNGGTAQVQTGDAQTQTVVQNDGINNSSYESTCCPNQGGSSATISDNGANSNNNVSYNSNNSQTVNVGNNATITNNFQITANTGNNTANKNDGDVYIQTGNIKILAAILNQNINTSVIKGGQSNNPFNLNISGNGAGSNNNAYLNQNNNLYTNVVNQANIQNILNVQGNTGGNTANKNKGNVYITTGDVLIDLILKNKDINTSLIVLACCQSETPTPPPTPTPTPSPSDTPNGGGGGGGGSSSGGGGGSSSGSGGGEVLGATLPTTGGYGIWEMTLLAIILLATGLYLRFSDQTNYTNPQTASNKVNFIDEILEQSKINLRTDGTFAITFP